MMRFGIISMLFLGCLSLPLAVFADEVTRNISFPINGTYSFRNDFHEPRGGGSRLHLGNDIIAEKMTPLVAVVDGYISFVARPQASWGYEIEIKDDAGWAYDYLHINNDTPGTDDGNGGEAYAYVSGVYYGARVSRGQLIGWVGDSGNAEETVPHLHFEIRDPNNTIVNPYPSLFAASGGKGVSASTPSTNTLDVSLEQRKVELRYIFTKELGYGATNNEVRQLQLVLKTFGYFQHPSTTGYFGDVTKAAVLSYQKKKSIPETGKLDLATRRALNNDLGTYDPNDYVPFYTKAELEAIRRAKILDEIKRLQALLVAMGIQ